jgi:hypothetical protein
VSEHTNFKIKAWQVKYKCHTNPDTRDHFKRSDKPRNEMHSIQPHAHSVHEARHALARRVCDQRGQQRALALRKERQAEGVGPREQRVKQAGRDVEEVGRTPTHQRLAVTQRRLLFWRCAWETSDGYGCETECGEIKIAID